MIVYSGSKREFLRSTYNDQIALEIERNVLERLGRHTPESELNSWRNSMQYMYRVMSDEDIPMDAGVAIEYNIPQTAKRVDFMITGYDESGKPGMVIIELKQWSELKKVENSNTLVESFVGHGMRLLVHPSYQAWSYAQLINDYNTYVQQEQVKLSPCAYLHNYQRQELDPIDDEQYAMYTNDAPAFTSGQAGKLCSFIKKFIRKGDNSELLYQIDHGKLKPSKSLQNAIASMMKGNEEFVMIDEQRVAYEEVISLSERCQRDGKKRTLICKGGAGTGKSVIAICLLSELTQRGQFVAYVSKNSAPREVYAEKLKGQIKKSSVDNMFKGSGSFTTAPKDIADTLLVDEAHRLNAKSGMYSNLGENQIKEIIHSAKCSVFFIDENQRVTTSDIGSVDEIKEWAHKEGSEVTEMELISQFRCNGSDGYLAWIDDLLEIRSTANYNIDGLGYDVRLCDSPEQLRKLILKRNKEANRARILAGYCWEWPTKSRKDPNYHDIVIGDFTISWNLFGGQAYATSETSVNEAGCIHTTQGLEFDYVGVIIGDDMRYENGHIVTDLFKRAKTDQSIKGLKGMYKKEPEKAMAIADEIIKNTYRTLMTRGMKGCYIYCTDKELQDYIRRRLKITESYDGNCYSYDSSYDAMMAAEQPSLFGKE